MNNIYLIGMMGSGKSSVGKKLSEAIGWCWVDTDQEVERTAQRTIPEIFSYFGEASFRDMETSILKRISKNSRQVVSTGGGIVLREENICLMKDSGMVIHLYADIHKLAERLVHSTDRPLLKGNHFERLTKIQQERKGKYDFAHLSIDTTNLTLEQSVERVIEYMKENGMA